MSYKKIYKPEPKKEGTATSLPSADVIIEGKAGAQQMQVHLGLSSNVQVAPFIAEAETGRIVEMHAGLSSNHQLFLEPREIYTNLSFDDIFYIKRHCRESRPSGEGSFARVYKMNFHGIDLAIKEIEHKSPHTKRWVENEVTLLLGKEHININKLCAWCIESSISYLAYMYIDGCSLDAYLRGNCTGFSYSWKQSFSMIMGIAKGIEFLHWNKIIHVDIKPQNIMVDANDNEAKIVDFGLSKHVDWEGTHRTTGMVVGTRGYWAPEYCWNNKISYKHDVFSFGIVVLEVITGQRHVDEARGSSQFHIPGYVRHMIENDRFEEAVDLKLKKDGWDIFAVEEALAVANIALRCAHSEKVERPDMNLVVTQLTSTMSSGDNSISSGQREEDIVPIEDVTSSQI
ncbi:hypothetical protein SUGI_0859350 [Cryptomeria japonica]|nr:hypothetical protein SUGI_0859350 [Cryptomeria japonica]